MFGVSLLGGPRARGRHSNGGRLGFLLMSNYLLVCDRVGDRRERERKYVGMATLVTMDTD